jgi:hypothetical protein
MAELLILDACVLIDLVDTDETVLTAIVRHLGPVHIAAQLLAEVDNLDESRARDLGLHIIEPSLDLLTQASTRRGRLSFEDHICLLLAVERGRDSRAPAPENRSPIALFHRRQGRAAYRVAPPPRATPRPAIGERFSSRASGSDPSANAPAGVPAARSAIAKRSARGPEARASDPSTRETPPCPPASHSCRSRSARDRAPSARRSQIVGSRAYPHPLADAIAGVARGREATR